MKRIDRHSHPPLASLLTGLVLCLAVAAQAAAPKPVRPVSADLYTGRWYEIARTPNSLQKDCEAPTSDFEVQPGGGFLLVDTCHRGGPRGEAKEIKAKGKIISPGDNTRFRVSFFGGLVHQEYWIVDHADDNAWALMVTPGGNYIWLLSRRPVLPPAVLATALAHAGALGYGPSKLIFPVRAAG